MPFNREKFINAFEAAIKRKKATGAICPMCSNNNWQLTGGYTLSSIQQEMVGIQLGGPAIPKVPIICTNCGFVAEIAIGVLGLLPKQEQVVPPKQDIVEQGKASEKTS